VSALLDLAESRPMSRFLFLPPFPVSFLKIWCNRPRAPRAVEPFLPARPGSLGFPSNSVSRFTPTNSKLCRFFSSFWHVLLSLLPLCGLDIDREGMRLWLFFLKDVAWASLRFLHLPFQPHFPLDIKGSSSLEHALTSAFSPLASSFSAPSFDMGEPPLLAAPFVSDFPRFCYSLLFIWPEVGRTLSAS